MDNTDKRLITTREDFFNFVAQALEAAKFSFAGTVIPDGPSDYSYILDAAWAYARPRPCHKTEQQKRDKLDDFDEEVLFEALVATWHKETGMTVTPLQRNRFLGFFNRRWPFAV